MDSHVSTERIQRDRRVAFVSICLGFVVAILAAAREFQMLHTFYVEAGSLPRGSEIRPMGFTLALGMTLTIAGLLGTCFALPGVILSFKYSRWSRMTAAILVAALCWLPLLVSPRALRHVVDLRGLVLAD